MAKAGFEAKLKKGYWTGKEKMVNIGPLWSLKKRRKEKMVKIGPL